MENPESQNQTDELLRQGIQAAKSGDREKARILLEQVVERDEYSEKGWFWLAAVVDTVEEKRVCLGNVVVVNPENQRAQRLLQQLEENEIDEAGMRAAVSGDSLYTFTPAKGGMSRSLIYTAIGLGAVAVLALVVVIVLLLGEGGDNEDSGGGSAPTIAVSGGLAGEETEVASTEPPVIVVDGTAVTATPIPPTPTPTYLPPTWTPAPSATPRPLGPGTPLPAPSSDIGGRILMRSGNAYGEADQPIVMVRPDGSNAQVISTMGERGHAPVFSPDGAQYAFIRYATGTGDAVLQFNNTRGTEVRWASTRWGTDPILINQDAPSWMPDGSGVVFSASTFSSTGSDLYLVSLVGDDADPANLTRLTEDSMSQAWHAVSPDSSQLVYVQTDAGGVSDLQILSLSDLLTVPLTSNAGQLTESAPDWSPDGESIVFHASESGASDSDIYRVSASGGIPEKLIDSDARDINPRYSPDGRYLVFSSDRTGNWDVFIFEIASGTIYQVTTSPHTDVANDWGQ